MRPTTSLLLAALLIGAAGSTMADEPPMKKYVTSQASFVVYAPEGWKVSETAESGYRTLIVSDPQGECEARLSCGLSLSGKDAVALARLFAGELGRQHADFQIDDAYVESGRERVVFDATYGHPRKGPRQLRCWVAVQDGEFTSTRIETPAGQLAAKRERLLSILANARLIRGAMQFAGKAPRVAPLVECRLSDGSASLRIPQGWKLHDLGTGSLVATAPDGPSSFIVGSVEVLSPQLGVRVPGTLVSEYLPPHKALELAATEMGLASNIRFLEVIRRKDLSDQMGLVYTVGPVQVEEFVQTATSKSGERTKGYSLGVSFGSRLNTGWKFWHMTASAPADGFDAAVPTLAAMMQSYRINDAFAADYIARGMVRLRELQRQTAELVARNAQEIHSMMQAAYQERQRSMDYIDYQRTNYIRGQQDWISSMEGGTVYHSNDWGMRNTATGDEYQGKPYDYVHFGGENPRYGEQMTPIDSRQLWERYIAR